MSIGLLWFLFLVSGVMTISAVMTKNAKFAALFGVVAGVLLGLLLCA